MAKEQNETSEAMLNAIIEDVMSGLGELADYSGFNRVIGQIYAVLLLSPQPLNMDEIMERVGKSKASVSSNIQILQNMGAVREVWVKGAQSRKYYEADSDILQIVTGILTRRELHDIERALSIMDENMKRLREVENENVNAETTAMAKHYTERIHALMGFFRFARFVMRNFLEQQTDLDIAKINPNA